jgi:hypothetical protein
VVEAASSIWTRRRRPPARPLRPATAAAVAGSCGRIGIVAGGALYVARAGSHRLRRLAGGGVSSPRLSYNGAGVSYARGGRVFAHRVGGHPRSIGTGRHPSPDGGSSAARPQGSVRAVAYERAGRIFLGRVGGRARRIGAGAAPSATAGAAQVLFGGGRSSTYATSNHFGKPYPQGICPAGQGAVDDTYASARANHVAFACAGGAIYLSYIGPK